MTSMATPSVNERRVVLVGIFLCIFLSALDQTIVSTALPRIVQDLGGTNLYAWVATSYLLASTIALPISGRLADQVSPKYILLVAVALFLVGSALSGLSHSMEELIIFRGIQGLGGGAIFSVASTVIGLLFPPRERGRVQGMFGAVFGLASVVGPYLGGLLTDSLSWRYVFYVNMPFGVVALYVLLVHMPLLRVPRRQAFDGAGVVALIAWTVPLLLALSWAGTRYAWLSPQILGLLTFATAVLVLFYWIERRSSAPLFHMGLLGNPTFTWAGIGTLFFGASFLGSVLFLPFYLVMAKNVSPLHAGLVMTPLTAGVVIGSMLGGIWASRLGRVKVLLLIGNIWAMTVFFVLYATLRPTMPMAHLILFMILLGVGIGPGFPLYTLAVQNVVRMDQMGVASSGNQFFRQIGSSIGAAVMGVLVVSTLKTEIPQHLPSALRGRAAAFSVHSNALTDQTQTRHRIMVHFRQTANLAEAAIRGNPAAYRTLTVHQTLPPRFARDIPPGGVPALVRASTARTLKQVAAAMAGNPAALSAVAADRALPPSIKQLAIHPPHALSARRAALARVRADLTAREPDFIRRLEQRAISSVRRAILQAGAKTSAQVVRALTISISNAVKRVMGMAGILAIMALGASLLLPNLELRRKAATPPAPANGQRGAILRLALLAVVHHRRGARPDAPPRDRERMERALQLLTGILGGPNRGQPDKTDDATP